jgi:hypothetical protein
VGGWNGPVGLRLGDESQIKECLTLSLSVSPSHLVFHQRIRHDMTCSCISLAVAGSVDASTGVGRILVCVVSEREKEREMREMIILPGVQREGC